MSWGSPTFVLMIIAITTGGWIINNWIRARHGYPLEDGAGNKVERADNQEALRLRDENTRLADRLEIYEDRLIVLEKIITDKGYDVAQQIEALRDADRKPQNESGAR